MIYLDKKSEKLLLLLGFKKREEKEENIYDKTTSIYYIITAKYLLFKRDEIVKFCCWGEVQRQWIDIEEMKINQVYDFINKYFIHELRKIKIENLH